MLFTGLGADTDCDGTSFYAKRIEADTLDEAWKQDKSGDIYDIMPESEFLEKFEAIFRGDDRHEMDIEWEREYYIDNGYASLGARWNPWVYDDSIGIPALDYTYDE